MLRVSHLTKRFGHVAALDDVSFTVRPGEALGLIGPNGAGKTTLFECVGGVLPADTGTIRVGGDARDLDQDLQAQDRAATVFYLPDAIAPWPSRTVRWAIEFTLGFFDGRVGLRDSVIRRLEVEPLLDARIGALSKGQRKRALLAIGLLTPQPVLLADEPFDGLDLRQTREVARTLRDHAAEGRTLVLSIHQIADAARVCDRFVLLSGGRVRGEGTLDELGRLAASRGAPTSGAVDLEEVFLALT